MDEKQLNTMRTRARTIANNVTNLAWFIAFVFFGVGVFTGMKESAAFGMVILMMGWAGFNIVSNGVESVKFFSSLLKKEKIEEKTETNKEEEQ